MTDLRFRERTQTSVRVLTLDLGLHKCVNRPSCSLCGMTQVVEAFLDPVAAAGGPEAFEKQFKLAKERALMRTKSWVMSRPDEIAHYYNSLAL